MNMLSSSSPKKKTSPSAGVTEEQIAGLTRLAMRLYCLPYSEEFRQPVEVKYPDLMDDYLTFIRTPADLGTILIKLKNQSYKSIQECAQELNLCFQNAIRFNADLSNLVSISNHLLSFTENLWHAIMQTPFTHASKKTTAAPDMQKFQQQMRKSRQIHFDETHSLPLKMDEMQYFYEQVQKLTIPKSSLWSDAFETMLNSCTTASTCDESEKEEEEEDKVKKDVEYPSVSQLISPIVAVMKSNYPCAPKQSQPEKENSDEDDVTTSPAPPTSPSPPSSEVVAGPDYSCFLSMVYADTTTYPSELSLENNEVLKQFESVLGEIISILFERCTRG